MSISIPIRRYTMENTKENMSLILSYFNTDKWKKIKKKDGLYRRKNTSFYWQVEKDNENINVDIWGIGSLGSIHSSISGRRPLSIQKIWDNMSDEFLLFLKDHDISQELNVRYIKTSPFKLRMIIMLLLTFIISFLIVVYTYY